MVAILRVNMRTGAMQRKPLQGKALIMGGRRLTSEIVAQEVPPLCHPLGKHNKLVLACGPLGGTLVSSVNRLSIGAKSPLTGGIKESNAGGVTAYLMGRLGLRAIVLEDKPQTSGQWRILHITAACANLIPANDLAGLGVFKKAEILHERYGKDCGLTLIGPVAERLLPSAGITNTDPDAMPSRYNGRGGLGAVMASKGILAIVFDAKEATKEVLHDAKVFSALSRQVAELINTTPQTAEIFRKYGTSAMMATTNAIGALPTRNFSLGSFNGFEKINADALYNNIVQRGGVGSPSHACMKGCLIKCSNVYPSADGKQVLCSPMEYETMGLMGSNLDIDDLDAIARLNNVCNDLGIDTIELGAALGIAMETGVLPFGDVQATENALEEIRQGTVFGRVLAAGAAVTGIVLGSLRVPVVKNQALPAYDPRSIKGLGVTYATSTQGADHTAGNTARAPIPQHLKDHQVETSKNAQRGFTLMDSLGFCLMLGGAVKDLNLMLDLVHARYGVRVSLEEVQKAAANTLQQEREFNLKAGLSEAHDTLPEFFYEEVNPTNQAVFDISQKEMQEVFK
ncbi:aldehyde ferredoxin oxidoreductase C-terminal domain-containing protein [Desulfovibrio cuneatus]|uniref:aldehyde ferredoxin oxidoreductase C-terminal domain-containing protein n=1 Tax=Desulfovibrio cuneatus TaxID=159728 RepID=UPI000424F41E|nr:aldehyde ferredoxin oxidoreductase C-terminal domain-containing protein [Desulfovibrio cuneatus]